MGCVEALKYEILLRHCSFKEAGDYIRTHCSECYEVPPGFKLFDVYIIGVPPVLVGIDDDTILFPYTKPCHGTFLLKVEGRGEENKIRAQGKRCR